MAYKKCPRCELNWIKDDEDLCDVCKAELKIGGMSLIEDDEDILDTEERICRMKPEFPESSSVKHCTKGI